MATGRNQSPQLQAGGTINPSRFVKLDTTHDNQGLQAGAGDRTIGISGVGTDDPPGITGSAGAHAVDGENIELFGIGDICLLQAGSGGYIRGDLLKSDASGQGQTSTTSVWVGAIALESAVSGEFGRVQVISPYRVP